MAQSHQSTPWYRWLKWGDYVIYAGIIAMAVLLFLQGPALLRPIIGGQAKVVVDGQLFQTIEASDLAGSGQLEFEANGYHYTVEYAAGRVRISQADCPDQVCVQTGWVSKLGEVSACVPGHLILSVDPPADMGTGSSDGNETEVDVIVR